LSFPELLFILVIVYFYAFAMLLNYNAAQVMDGWASKQKQRHMGFNNQEAGKSSRVE